MYTFSLLHYTVCSSQNNMKCIYRIGSFPIHVAVNSTLGIVLTAPPPPHLPSTMVLKLGREPGTTKDLTCSYNVTCLLLSLYPDQPSSSSRSALSVKCPVCREVMGISSSYNVTRCDLQLLRHNGRRGSPPRLLSLVKFYSEPVLLVIFC
jgi:hypothetical protein